MTSQFFPLLSSRRIGPAPMSKCLTSALRFERGFGGFSSTPSPPAEGSEPPAQRRPAPRPQIKGPFFGANSMGLSLKLAVSEPPPRLDSLGALKKCPCSAPTCGVLEAVGLFACLQPNQAGQECWRPKCPTLLHGAPHIRAGDGT